MDGVAIGTVEPAVLLEGGEATIRGRGFSISVANNLVLLDGIPAPVTAASATQLTIRVPRGDCLPPRKAKLGVTVLGLSDTLGVSVTPTVREDIDLDPGWYRYTFAERMHAAAGGHDGRRVADRRGVDGHRAFVTPVSVSGIPGYLDVFRSLSVPRSRLHGGRRRGRRPRRRRLRGADSGRNRRASIRYDRKLL